MVISIQQKEGFMKIGIIGRQKSTKNYEHILYTLRIPFLTSLTIGELASCDALILPGGGDITPELYGQPNLGSHNIDTELDLLQLRALEQAMKAALPILGICKGMQLINIVLGGTLIQHLDTYHLHTDASKDVYHTTIAAKDSFLFPLYGDTFFVNSSHHQAVAQPATDLTPVQWCTYDSCIEAICHTSLPILGVQWHPERLHTDTVTGIPLFQHFLSFA